MAAFDHKKFSEMPLVGILRGFQDDWIKPIVDSFIKVGLPNLEITLNSPNAFGQIENAVAFAQGRLNIGAGTVTGKQGLEDALNAGANFVVSPNTKPEIICACRDQNIPIFPGAYSPTEILKAHEFGATAVKIFPANNLSFSFLKNLHQELPKIRLMPTGGITAQNLPKWIQSGAAAFGIGSPLFPKALLENGLAERFQAHLATFVNTYKTHPINH